MDIQRCENGFIIKYKGVSKSKEHLQFGKTVQRMKVFISRAELLHFVEEYFKGGLGD